MSSKSCKWFFTLAGAVIIASCAKVSAPTGGMRDRVPPEVVESTPVNGETNFRGKRVEIKFDEYVSLDNINDKFMVSPPMKQKPRVYTRGKSVRVDYTDKLRDSTTYTFYFMDAIKDLNEGNVLNGYKLAFSTGPVIDSLSVTGNVYTALNLEVPEKTSVLLFSNFDDTAVVKTIPDYLSRVDQTGYFRIDNVRPGKYRLFALKDEDNSKNYNRVEEPFAFLDSTISVTPEKNYIPPEKDTVKIRPQLKKAPVKTTPPIKTFKTSTSTQKDTSAIPVKTGDYKLILFQGPKTARYLAGTARPPNFQGSLLTYFLSLPPDTMHFSFRIDSVADNKFFIEKTRNRDTINVWLTDSTIYSRKTLNTIIEYPFTDSLGKDIYKTDTVKMLYVAPRALRGGKKRQKLETTNNIAAGSLKPGQRIVFNATTPLKDPDTSKIRLYEIAEKQRTQVPYIILHDTIVSEKLTLDSRFVEGRQYLLITDSAAFSNIYNVVSDSAGMRFTVRERASYSSLIINLRNCGGNCIVQLLDKSEKVLAWKRPDNNGKIVFSLLEKGTYRLRAFNDLNGDGKWTTGDYFRKRQPEPSIYYDEIELPEGWEATQEWNINQWNYKNQRLRQQNPLQR